MATVTVVKTANFVIVATIVMIAVPISKVTRIKSRPVAFGQSVTVNLDILWAIITMRMFSSTFSERHLEKTTAFEIPNHAYGVETIEINYLQQQWVPTTLRFGRREM